MRLDKIHSAYFIGIGGIGMSALARYFMQRGIRISGYDRSPSDITQSLAEAGVPIHFDEDISQIPKDVDLVVYTPAIPPGNKELAYCRGQGISVLKRSEVLEEITCNHFTIAVAGTHGKTTISAMTAWVLDRCGLSATAFLGGIANNYHSNFIYRNTDRMVVEADEYDRSFLRLHPDIAVISAIDPDHLDIYGSAAELEAAFYAFTLQVAKGGKRVVKAGLPIVRQIQRDRVLTYGINETADVTASDVRIQNGQFTFTCTVQGEVHTDFILRFPGFHNVENALAAISVAHILGADMGQVREALAGFTGIRRRFEYVVDRPGFVFIDDYAHHPEEINALLYSVRGLYPGRHVTAVFQPHLYSRTRDLAEGFAQALDRADRTVLLPIYPAREEPIPGIGSETILERMKLADTCIASKSELVDTLKAAKPDVLLTIGAGDIDKLVPIIKEAFKSEPL